MVAATLVPQAAAQPGPVSDPLPTPAPSGVGVKLQEIARLFPRARSLQTQRAIANILIRADLAGLARADLARLLREHRLKSLDGSDVIDALIRVLQAA